MKRLLALLIAPLMGFSLVACGHGSGDPQVILSEPPANTEASEAADKCRINVAPSRGSYHVAVVKDETGIDLNKINGWNCSESHASIDGPLTLYGKLSPGTEPLSAIQCLVEEVFRVSGDGVLTTVFLLSPTPPYTREDKYDTTQSFMDYIKSEEKNGRYDISFRFDRHSIRVYVSEEALTVGIQTDRNKTE